MLKKLLGFCLLIASATAHSWIDAPFPRDWRLRAGGNEIDNGNVGGGCPYDRAFGVATYDTYGMVHVHPGDTLTVRHVGRGHENNPRRGWSRVSISYGEDDLQEDFDCNVLANNINHDMLNGYCVQIPESAPLGMATIQWWWDFEGAGIDFTSCADIMIVDHDAPTTAQPSCQIIRDPVTDARGNVSPLLPLPECSGQDCTIEVNLRLGNPENVVVDSLTHQNGCFDDSLPVDYDETCLVQMNVNIDHYGDDQFVVNSVMYSSNCTDLGGDDGGGDDGGGDDGGGEGPGCLVDTTNPPSGYCCLNSQCPGSYCKNYKAPFPNGYYVCQ